MSAAGCSGAAASAGLSAAGCSGAAASAGLSAAACSLALTFSSLALSFSNVFFLGLSCFVCLLITGLSASFSLARNFWTLSVGLAPTDNQYLILSLLSVTLSGSLFSFIGLYVPSLSRYLPSLGALTSAATILKKGLFFEPPLDNLSATAILFSFG